MGSGDMNTADHEDAGRAVFDPASPDAYRLIVEHIQDGLFVIRDGRVVYVNAALADMIGASVAEMIGLGIGDLVAPEHLDMVAGRYRARLAGADVPACYEFDLRHRNGRDRVAVQMSVGVVKEPDGALSSIGTLKNVSGKKRMLDELRRSEQEFRRIVEALPDAFYRTDAEGRVEMISPSCTGILGYTPDEMIGRPLADFYVDPADRQRVLAALAANDGRPTHVESLLRHKNGAEVWVSTNAFFRRDEAGAVIGVEGIARDDTARKGIETAVRESREELERSNTDLQQFAYAVSHDLQEPLRMVSSYLQLLERRYGNALGDDAREFIGFATDGAARMRRMINDLLEYSRVQSQGKAPTATESADALDVALANLEVAMKEAGAGIDRDDPLPTVLADPGQLARLFQNLVGNAVKFRDPARPPRIHVGAACTNGCCTFSVRDNGIGIESRHFERVFGVFQRLHGRDAYEGTGIGLAVCKRIVERHGGRIGIESEPGVGSTIWFTLPMPS